MCDAMTVECHLPNVGDELATGSGVLVQLLLKHGCIVREALLPSEGISGQFFLSFVKGQLSPPVPLVLQDQARSGQAVHQVSLTVIYACCEYWCCNKSQASTPCHNTSTLDWMHADACMDALYCNIYTAGRHMIFALAGLKHICQKSTTC